MLSHKYILECLEYNRDTGVFTWRERPEHHFKSKSYQKRFNSRFSGSVAGCEFTNSSGKRYLVVTLFGRSFYLHRLAIFYVSGEMPEFEVDHHDGDGTNNRYENISKATRKQNMKNVRLPDVNTSGVVGVGWVEKKGMWRARVKVNQKDIHLGYFHSLSEAVEAREDANKKYGFHKNHGSKRPLAK